MPRKRVCPEFPGRFGEYPETLLEPIIRRPPAFGLLTSADEKKRSSDEEKNRVHTAFVFKLRLLAKHFDINWDRPNALGRLALKLAMAHVPGMQIVDAPKKGRGRPKRFIDIRDPSPFLREVDAIRAENKVQISDAIRAWKRQNKSSETEPRLRRRYYLERDREKEIAAAFRSLIDQERSK
jgi:hypothetical protein